MEEIRQTAALSLQIGSGTFWALAGSDGLLGGGRWDILDLALNLDGMIRMVHHAGWTIKISARRFSDGFDAELAERTIKRVADIYELEVTWHT